jgi:hypothetical protein
MIYLIMCDTIRRSPSVFMNVVVWKSLSVCGQHKWFKEGHKNMEDDERHGPLRSHRTHENVAKVWNLVHSNRCLSQL